MVTRECHWTTWSAGAPGAPGALKIYCCAGSKVRTFHCKGGARREKHETPSRAIPRFISSLEVMYLTLESLCLSNAPNRAF